MPENESPSESVDRFLLRLAQRLEASGISRPFPSPPAELRTSLYPIFRPAHDLRDWARETFLEEGSPLHNPDHRHLLMADVLFVWSSGGFKSKGRYVAGTAQLGTQQGGGPGKKEYLESFYREWNGGRLPDFIITICAPFVIEADPASICALIDHEYYHCGQVVNEFGISQYRQSDGLPKFALVGHDIEEFVGVVRRFGDLGNPNMIALREALNREPSIERAKVVAAVCGCGASV